MSERLTIPRQEAVAVLTRMAEGSGGAIATHWLDHAAGCPGDTAKTRRLLVKLQRFGLVEGQAASRSGRVFWWKITDEGRAFIERFKPGAAPGDAATEAGRV